MGVSQREQDKPSPNLTSTLFHEVFQDQQTTSYHFQVEHHGAVNREKNEEKHLGRVSRNNEETGEIYSTIEHIGIG